MRMPEAFTTHFRKDTQKYQFTLNPACGFLPRVCLDWKRRSFATLPDDLAQYREAKSDKSEQAGVNALIVHLLKRQVEEGNARRVSTDYITVGTWIEKFTAI